MLAYIPYMDPMGMEKYNCSKPPTSCYFTQVVISFLSIGDPGWDQISAMQKGMAWIRWLNKAIHSYYMAVGQNLVPLVNIKIAGKWMFIPLKMVLIGIDPYTYIYNNPNG